MPPTHHTSKTMHPAHWAKEGARLPNGTLVRCVYEGRELQGVIHGGRWNVEGVTYRSPTAALAAHTEGGRDALERLIAWKTWFVKRPEDFAFVKLGSLR